MLSRNTTLRLAEILNHKFTYRSKSSSSRYVSADELYDWLYERDYPAWFCNAARKLFTGRAVKDWIMQLHTGESVTPATTSWAWEQRRKLGQEYLEELTNDLFAWWDTEKLGAWNRDWYQEAVNELRKAVELDGYKYKDGRLLRPEADILDVQAQVGVLHELYTSLNLQQKEVAFHHLQLSEEHFVAGRWGDSISNSRNFLEATLREVASDHSFRTTGARLKQADFEKPVVVREYLEREKLIESKEKEAIAKVYGLLSNTGSHPYMAQDDQARLLRHLALTLAQFVMLRYKGSGIPK